MTHLLLLLRHAQCRERGVRLVLSAFGALSRLILLGVLLLWAAPAYADGMGSGEEAAASEELSVDPLDMEWLNSPPSPSPRWRFSELPPWETLEEGLQLGLFPASFEGGNAFDVVILRIDPAFYDFTVETASAEGRSLSLGEWARRKDLAAAINASMYLPDGVTSTGYLRAGDVINNGRIASRFGAFFVAGPDGGDLPGADLLDRTTDEWEARLARYRCVVQNYRMISADRHLLWKAGGPQHSISAVARDGIGAILFILCREPLTGVDFGKLLLDLPLDVRLVMYTEGGSQAGLLVRTPVRRQLWMGRSLPDFLMAGNQNAPLPNVIGVRRKPGAHAQRPDAGE